MREDKAPFGQPLFLAINSLDLSVSYAVTDRWTVSTTLPFSKGTHSRYYADGVRHRVAAAGLGDVSVVGSGWLFDPGSHPAGNVSLGAGVKSPSGRNDVSDTYFLPQGTSTFTVDQSIQLGDGGWGLILQGLAFARLFDRVSGYASGSYLVTPKNQSSVLQAPSGSSPPCTCRFRMSSTRGWGCRSTSRAATELLPASAPGSMAYRRTISSGEATGSAGP